MKCHCYEQAGFGNYTWARSMFISCVNTQCTQCVHGACKDILTIVWCATYIYIVYVRTLRSVLMHVSFVTNL